MFKRLRKVLSFILKLYILYALAAGVLIFAFPVSPEPDWEGRIDSERFYGEEGYDQVVLLENPYLAALARRDLIAGAQETIDVAYYSLARDYSAEAFIGELLAAADRGVKVRILLDGVRALGSPLKKVRSELFEHENIELKLYEPIDLVRPWTWNNRLHDKYIIADYSHAIIGGRNIGLRFFDPQDKSAVRDRDVLIISQGKQDPASVLHQFKAYFTEQWQSPWAERAGRGLFARFGSEDVRNRLQAAAEELFPDKIDWHALAFPTNKVTLIHNPLGRLNQEPWILMEVAALLASARERAVLQSPYFIPTPAMEKFLPSRPLAAETVIVTNHPGSPGYANLSAMAGYLNRKQSVKRLAAEIHEYYDPSRSLHAKTYVFDSRLSLVGSFNFDARSSFLSTESMVVIDSPEFAELLTEKIKGIIGDSQPAEAMTPLRKVSLSILRLVFWPFSFLL
ncbi:MAG: phospholipase D family protein [Firmicutes bacterium]|nr:phospholipase D family protein [Bacillota bacterium]